jgi:ABC-2 type transport system ATP-binding protein
MISLRGLTKKFGDFTAVNDLNLDVARGEFFGFLGPNGAGKTTTVRMIAGLARPTHGDIEVDGVDMVKRPLEAKRRLGLIPDRPFLYTRLRGEEFLHFVADLYEVPMAVQRERMEQYLHLFHLEKWRYELIESYSHGMRQKLIFTAALLHDPPVLVVDEPLVGLDPEGVEAVKNLLAERCRNGCTVFMSTHSLEVVESLCARVGIILEGRLIALGSVEDIKRQAERHSSAALVEAFLALTRQDPEEGS